MRAAVSCYLAINNYLFICYIAAFNWFLWKIAVGSLHSWFYYCDSSNYWKQVYFFYSFRMVGVASAPWAIKTWKIFLWLQFTCFFLSLSVFSDSHFILARLICTRKWTTNKFTNCTKNTRQFTNWIMLWTLNVFYECAHRISLFLHIVFIVLGSESSIGIFIASNTPTVAANSFVWIVNISVFVHCNTLLVKLYLFF